MTDEAVLNVLYGILAEDEPAGQQTSSQPSSSNNSEIVNERPRRSSFHILFGDELKEAVGEDFFPVIALANTNNNLSTEGSAGDNDSSSNNNESTTFSRSRAFTWDAMFEEQLHESGATVASANKKGGSETTVSSSAGGSVKSKRKTMEGEDRQAQTGASAAGGCNVVNDASGNDGTPRRHMVGSRGNGNSINTSNNTYLNAHLGSVSVGTGGDNGRTSPHPHDQRQNTLTSPLSQRNQEELLALRTLKLIPGAGGEHVSSMSPSAAQEHKNMGTGGNIPTSGSSGNLQSYQGNSGSLRPPVDGIAVGPGSSSSGGGNPSGLLYNNSPNMRSPKGMLPPTGPHTSPSVHSMAPHSQVSGNNSNSPLLLSTTLGSSNLLMESGSGGSQTLVHHNSPLNSNMNNGGNGMGNNNPRLPPPINTGTPSGANYGPYINNNPNGSANRYNNNMQQYMYNNNNSGTTGDSHPSSNNMMQKPQQRSGPMGQHQQPHGSVGAAGSTHNTHHHSLPPPPLRMNSGPGSGSLSGSSNAGSGSTLNMQAGSSASGIVVPYTREERALRIARYLAKKQRRVWKKNVKYDCRKRLAEGRPRVKGRFVSHKAGLQAAEGEGGASGDTPAGDGDTAAGDGGSDSSDDVKVEGEASDMKSEGSAMSVKPSASASSSSGQTGGVDGTRAAGSDGGAAESKGSATEASSSSGSQGGDLPSTVGISDTTTAGRSVKLQSGDGTGTGGGQEKCVTRGSTEASGDAGTPSRPRASGSRGSVTASKKSDSTPGTPGGSGTPKKPTRTYNKSGTTAAEKLAVRQQKKQQQQQQKQQRGEKEKSSRGGARGSSARAASDATTSGAASEAGGSAFFEDADEMDIMRRLIDDDVIPTSSGGATGGGRSRSGGKTNSRRGGGRVRASNTAGSVSNKQNSTYGLGLEVGMGGSSSFLLPGDVSHHGFGGPLLVEDNHGLLSGGGVGGYGDDDDDDDDINLLFQIDHEDEEADHVLRGGNRAGSLGEEEHDMLMMKLDEGEGGANGSNGTAGFLYSPGDNHSPSSSSSSSSSSNTTRSRGNSLGGIGSRRSGRNHQ